MNLYKFPLGCDFYMLPQLVRYSCITYHPIMDHLWWTNEYLFNVWVSISADCLDESIGRMDIVYFSIYEFKWWYFKLICFALGLVDGAWSNVSVPLLSSNSLHTKIVETAPTLYPRSLISFSISMIWTVLLNAWLCATISRDEGYPCQELRLPYNWTSQWWYKKSWAITCHIWIILIFLWKPITAEISIFPYLDVAITRSYIYKHFVGFLQLFTYNLESLNMWFFDPRIFVCIHAPRI